MWLILAFISAALLGMYEVFKKLALNNNAVLPILFLNTVFCSALFLPAVLLSRFNPELIEGTLFYVPRADFVTHLYVMLKAVIVLSRQVDILYRVGHYHGSHQCPVRQISHLGRIRPHGRTSVVYLLPDDHHVHHTSHLV